MRSKKEVEVGSTWKVISCVMCIVYKGSHLVFLWLVERIFFRTIVPVRRWGAHESLSLVKSKWPTLQALFGFANIVGNFCDALHFFCWQRLCDQHERANSQKNLRIQITKQYKKFFVVLTTHSLVNKGGKEGNPWAPLIRTYMNKHMQAVIRPRLERRGLWYQKSLFCGARILEAQGFWLR